MAWNVRGVLIMFTVRGTYLDEKATLKWDRGNVTGHELAVKEFHRWKQRDVGIGPDILSPKGHDTAKDEAASMVLFYHLLYPVTSTTGKVPKFKQSKNLIY